MTTNTVSHDVWSTPLTPLAFLGRAAEVLPDREAVVYGERRMTYTQLSEEVTRVAHALRACGVNPGDRVAYLMPNIPEMLVAQFAVPLAGGVLVAINTRAGAAGGQVHPCALRRHRAGGRRRAARPRRVCPGGSAPASAGRDCSGPGQRSRALARGPRSEERRVG